MDKIIHFFENIESWQRTVLVVGGIVLFWLVESAYPLFHYRYNKVKHAGLNFFFTLTTLIVNFVFAFLIVKASDYAYQHQLGILNLVRLPLWLYILAGMMILDFISSWLIHWIQHKIKWMWKFHLIHHSDTWVDTTTSTRHHPMESIFRAAFTLLAVLLAGVPIWLLFFYQFLSVLLSQLNHANFSFPKWLDNALGWIIVTPDMHKVHHHNVQPLTDTNYGNIFSIWDRIFGTYAYVKDVKTLQYGIDTYPEEKENNSLGKLLKIPFEEYRAPAGSKFSNSNSKE
ncbi:MAG: sterol desaturase [Bacteroidetes bacterium]|nr:MAG: sterol desaturase [Bacteroidota bacterium]